MAYWVPAAFRLLVFILSSSWAWAAPHLHRICPSSNGTNTLEWFINKDTCEDLVQIEIYARENKSSSFVKVGSTSNGKLTGFAHTGAGSFQSGSYFLRYMVKCGGNSVSFYSDTLDVDSKAPDIIDPDSVSIVGGKVVVGWTAAHEPDAKSYVIYRTVGSANFPIDTVFGKFNTFYKDSQVGDPTTKSERYKIAAVDSCDNIAPIGDYHETIFLSISADTCKGELYVKWTPYIGWDNGVERYEVLVSDGSGFKSMGTTKNLIDTLRGLKTNTVYAIFARAYKKGGGSSSSSNVVIHKADFGDVLEYLYLSTVTYDPDKLKIEWVHSAHSALDHFELFRGKDKLRLVKIRDLPKGQLTWTDNNAGNTVWYYQVRAYNTCGKMLAESNVSNSMVLTVTKENDKRVLRWNAYASWLNGVGRYDIYKVVYGSNTTNLLPIGTTDKSTTFFTDTQSILLDTIPGACYYVEARESGLNKLGISGISHSNTVCYRNAPIIYIPNAFVPHEYTNTHFKPSLVNVDLPASNMVIFNRWGQRIAEDVNLETGWDGKMHSGHMAPEGVYFYVLSVVGIDGSRQVYKGTVTLL